MPQGEGTGLFHYSIGRFYASGLLARGAEEGGAAGLDLAIDDSLAAFVAAGLALAVVDLVRALEVAQLPEEVAVLAREPAQVPEAVVDRQS